MMALSVLRSWGRRRWLAAAGAAVLGILVVAVPTDLIDTPLFSRQVPPTWWSWPALLASGVLGGLLTASYVRQPGDVPVAPEPAGDRSRTWGSAGGVLTFFAVGCPVCNKIALLALGAGGALTWFAPVQPLLSALALLLLGWALRRRLLGELACPVTVPMHPTPDGDAEPV